MLTDWNSPLYKYWVSSRNVRVGCSFRKLEFVLKPDFSFSWWITAYDWPNGHWLGVKQRVAGSRQRSVAPPLGPAAVHTALFGDVLSTDVSQVVHPVSTGHSVDTVIIIPQVRSPFTVRHHHPSSHASRSYQVDCSRITHFSCGYL